MDFFVIFALYYHLYRNKAQDIISISYEAYLSHTAHVFSLFCIILHYGGKQQCERTKHRLPYLVHSTRKPDPDNGQDDAIRFQHTGCDADSSHLARHRRMGCRQQRGPAIRHGIRPITAHHGRNHRDYKTFREAPTALPRLPRRPCGAASREGLLVPFRTHIADVFDSHLAVAQLSEVVRSGAFAAVGQRCWLFEALSRSTQSVRRPCRRHRRCRFGITGPPHNQKDIQGHRNAHSTKSNRNTHRNKVLETKHQ